MKLTVFVSFAVLQVTVPLVAGFSVPKNHVDLPQVAVRNSPTTLFQVSSPTSDEAPKEEKTKDEAAAVPKNKKKKTIEELRAEGGIFTFNTPIGALNPYAIYYGLVSIFLGIPWYISLKLTQLLYFVSRGRIDPKRRIPVTLSHLWGWTLAKLSLSTPEYVNRDVLKDFLKKGKPAMFVANHNSWMDIPFTGLAVGWRNYKLVSKKELGIVPILGTAIRVGGNIMVDRLDRRSQIKTLKQGINYLKKEGVSLCAFPEGTRSRDGRMLRFKNGAFKMAHKAGAPVIVFSIVNSHKAMPHGWMFAMKPARGVSKVVFHEPIESEGKTEKELAEAVRQAMIDGLPDYQKPLK